MSSGLSKIGDFYHRIKDFILVKSDPVLLVFLVFMLNYRLSFKLIALAFIFILKPRIQFKLNGLVWFYLSMIFLGVVNFFFVNQDYSMAHALTVMTGCIIWLACLLVYFQMKQIIERNDTDKIINTLKLLVIINFISSCIDLFKVIFITRAINPFTQVSPPPYGISSGDLIGGLFGSMHLVNTIICAMLLIFFVYRGSLTFTLLCLIPFLLTGSNLGTFILVGILVPVAFLNKGIHFKNLSLFSITFIALFYIKVTPSNQLYMQSVLKKVVQQFKVKENKNQLAEKIKRPTVDSAFKSNLIKEPQKKVLTKDELIIQYVEYRKKLLGIKTFNNSQTIDTGLMKKMYSFRKHKQELEWRLNDYVFFRKDSVAKSKSNMALFEYGRLKKFDLDQESGKVTSFKQTKTFLGSNLPNALFGAGIGSFSSRLAFITCGIVEDSRLLMALPYYETQIFKDNHKAIFKYLMYRDDETHSITNLPFCWYNQVLGEYGLIGFVVFMICYCGFWLKRYKNLTFGKYIFIAMLGFFFFDYWYERLSVVIVFEFLMLLDLKLTKKAEV